MPTYSAHKTKEKCPKCGNQLVSVHMFMIPFPEDSDSEVSQTTVGCSACGYQTHEHRRDPRGERSEPNDWPKEYFIADEDKKK